MASAFLELSYTLITCLLLYYFLFRSFAIKENRSKLIRHWILFGFIFNFYSFSWLYTVYPLSWIQTGIIQLLGIALLHLIISVSVSLCFFVVAYSYHPYLKHGLLPSLFAASLVIAEVLRSWMISLLSYGKGTTIALHFTAGTIGNALSTTPLIEFAYFGGTFGLTFILGYIIYCLHSKKSFLEYRAHLVAIIVALFCIHFFIPVRTPPIDTKIGIVTTNLQELHTEKQSLIALKDQSIKVHALTLSFASPTPSIIVYPEDTRYFSGISLAKRGELSKNFNTTLFIDGDTLPVSGHYSNISLFYYPEKDKKLARGKEFLLPFNEYVPYIFTSLFRVFIAKDKIDAYVKNHTFVPVFSDKSILFNDTRVGTLLCSEILSFSVISRLKKEKPDIVFFQSRLNVFHDNLWFVMHMRSFTKVTAATLRTTLISSTNNAPSFVISPYGKIIRMIPTGYSTSTYTVSQ